MFFKQQQRLLQKALSVFDSGKAVFDILIFECNETKLLEDIFESKQSCYIFRL